MLKLFLNSIFIYVACLSTFPVNAQDCVDSLENVLQVTKVDSQRIAILNRLAYNYRRNPQKVNVAKEYLREAIDLGENGDYKAKLARSYDNLGVIQRDEGEYQKSISNHTKALEAAKSRNDEKGEMHALNNLGVVHRRMNNLEIATQFHLDALKIAEKINDLRSIAIVINSLGNVYNYLKNYDKAYEYFQRGLEIEKSRNNDLGIAINLNNIGWVHREKKEYETALKYYLESLEINKKINSLMGMAICYNDAGFCYKNLDNPTKAINFFLKALSLNTEIADRNNIAFTRINIGSTYLDIEKVDLAIKYLPQGLEGAKEVGAKDNTKTALEQLSKAYQQKGQFEQALAYYKEAILYKDSVYTEETSRNIAQMEAKFETKKKETEIDFLKQKNATIEEKLEAEYRVQLAMAVIIALSLFLLFALYRVIQQKQWNNRLLVQKNEEIQEKNEEIQSQSEEIRMKNEDITDSIRYAQRIQNAILGEEANIINHLRKGKSGNNCQCDGFIFYLPRDIVSGDYYWYAEVENESTSHINKVFIAADCTGHGVPGAFMTMMGNALLNEIIVERKETNPAVILQLLDEKLQTTLNKEGSSGKIYDGMDMSILVIDEQSNQIHFAGAKNPLFYTSKEGTATEMLQIKGSSSAIGSNPFNVEKAFEKHTLEINQIHACYMFSDGYKDQFGGEHNKKYMNKRFREFLFANSHLPMPEQKEQLENEFFAWKGKRNQTDDVLVVGLKFG